MAQRLSGKSALITGAGQGIGRATALRFAGEGAQVWATDINKDALDAIAAEDGAIKPRLLDVRSRTAAQTLAEEVGKGGDRAGLARRHRPARSRSPGRGGHAVPKWRRAWRMGGVRPN